MTLNRIQAALSELYDVEVDPRVEDFVCDADIVRQTAGHGPEDRGEVLVVAEDEEGVSVGLYVCASAVAAVGEDVGAAWLDSGRFQGACLATEGVSHFLYLAFREQNDQGVTQLELELQAEVDKYATALLSGNGVGAIRARSRDLRRRLFGHVRFLDGRDSPEGERYRLAHRLAARYLGRLEESFLARADVGALLRELRRFYRLGLREKVETASR